jgi:prepilin-type N-terminal cleavage/methylation domain-containing protein
MKRQQSGFTLVELLVVITIIGILMGLLIPAVNAARETARRNQCAANIKNFALAGVQYENTKGSLPSWVDKYGYFAGGQDASDLGNFGGTVPPHVKVGGFGVALLPWLDAQPTYEHWTQDRYPIISDGNGEYDATSGLSGDGFHELAAPNLAIFQCPSNPVSEGSHGKNSYASNNGMSAYRTEDGHQDFQAVLQTAVVPINPAGTGLVNAQKKANGCFTAQYRGANMAGALAVADAPDLDDLKDGQGYTILFSENVQAAPWHRPGFIDGLTSGAVADLAPLGPNQDILTGPKLEYSQYTNGLVWHYEDEKYNQLNSLPNPPTSPNGSAVADVFQQHKINGGGDTVSKDIFNLTMDQNVWDAPSLARPSSAHVDGVNCAFADGQTRFVTSSIDYRVYQAILTPRGKSSDVPWQEFVLTDEIGQ